MSAAVRVRTVRISAELALVALHADTLAVLAVTVSAAVWHLALLVPDTHVLPSDPAADAGDSPDVALLALPARPADTLPGAVLALAAAQHGAHTQLAALTVVARVTDAGPRHTLPVPVTPGPAALGQVPAPGHQELHLVSLAIIIVQRHEPVTRLQEETFRPADGTLKNRKESMNT